MTYKPLKNVVCTCPVSCMIYACDKGLLNKEASGWLQFKQHVKKQKHLLHIV